MNKVITAFLLSIVILAGCSNEESSIKVAEPRPVILVSPIQSSSIVEYSLPAVIEASSSRDLAFQVNGQIVTLNVKEGDDVTKGQVLAQLNLRQFDNRVRAASADLELTKVQYNRAKKLIASNAMAKNQFDQIKASLERVKTEFDNAQKDREDAVLTSPFDGVISVTHTKELQAVMSGEKVVTVDTFGDAEAVVNIPANIVAFEQQYKIIDIQTYLDVIPTMPLESKLVEVSTTADVRSQTYKAKYSFTPPSKLTILPGMTAVVKAKVDYGENRKRGLLLPVSAVMSDSSGKYVWVFDESTQSVNKKTVSVAKSISKNVLIIDGLSIEDQVVGAGGSFLLTGMKVRKF